MPLGNNIIGQSGVAAFFQVVNPDEVGIAGPTLRRGDALRTWVRSLSGFQKEAIVRSARTGVAWRLVSDEGPYLDGHDAAPCPLAFLTTGMIASYMNEITALAKAQGVAIRKLRLIQDNYYTMRGSMPKRTMVGGALPVELTVEIDCDLAGPALNQFLMNAVDASPLNGLMRGKLDSLFTLGKNGIELPPAKATPLGAPLMPDPGDRFPRAKPAAGPSPAAGPKPAAGPETVADPGPLLQPVGLTPAKVVEKGTSAAASSLADEQDRRLNVGAVCTLRDDGMKEIVQLLYSPHGTSFRFLSEEAPVNNGQGRAPDANSYISAGIGFCFMTQFGRFVSMLNLNLDAYRIVQDTHFSLGGASGGTGVAGAADPVETHVHLITSESDQVAQEMLDISEQTCFLHAFCRTDLKTKLKIVSV